MAVNNLYSYKFFLSLPSNPPAAPAACRLHSNSAAAIIRLQCNIFNSEGTDITKGSCAQKEGTPNHYKSRDPQKFYTKRNADVGTLRALYIE